MTDKERAEVARIIGWLEGFAPAVWLLPSLKWPGGEQLVADEACAGYEERGDRLWSIVMEDE